MLNQLNLYGVIGDDVKAKDVKAQLEAMDQTQPLHVKIDSEGGSVFEGFSIANALEEYAGPKKVVIEPCAFSIASYIALVFDEVEIVENGYVMAHLPYSEYGGTAEEMAQNAKLLADMEAKMLARYSMKTGLSEQELRDQLKKEEFLNAEQAVSMGLCSRVVKAQKKTRSQLRAKLPVQVFAALRGEGLGSEKVEEKKMSTQPVAATLAEIRAAFPKAKSDFVLSCLEKSLPMASVASAAVEEMMTENAALKEQCQALEEKCKALEAKAAITIEEEPAETETEGEMCEAKAKAKPGVKPVARANGGTSKSARAEWESAIDAEVKNGKSKFEAGKIVNKKFPGLRARYLQEVNAQ